MAALDRVFSSRSMVNGPVGPVYDFLKANNLLELADNLSWASTLEDLLELKTTDPSFNGIPNDVKERFQRAVDVRMGRAAPAEGAGGKDYVNIAAVVVHGPVSEKVRAASLMQLEQLMLESDDEGGDDYVNQEAVRLHQDRSRAGSASSGSSAQPPALEGDEEEGDAGAGGKHEYVNQEAIELHMIEALQPWMHGSIDRTEAERRLKHTGKDGAFLVRMKGHSGRMYVFSILSDSARGTVTHNLIEFVDVEEGHVRIDNNKLPKPCKSLKSVVKIVCHAHNKRMNQQRGAKKPVQLMGVRDKLLEHLEKTESEWHLPLCKRSEAEFKLAKELPGTFLVRNSSEGGKCISIRLPQNKMLNVKVDHKGAGDGYLVGKCQLPPLVTTLPEVARAIIVDVTILRKTQDGIAIRMQALRSS